MTRTFRKTLVFSLVLASVASGRLLARQAVAETPKRSPNVLFIAVDDLRTELGCYGSDAIKSPSIDRLAASGVTFTRAYCQQAACNPSRASLMTGLRPDRARVWDLIVHFRDVNPEVVTLSEHFLRHGYYAAAYGKIFHNTLPDRRSFSEPNHWPERVNLFETPAGRN